MDVQNSVSKKSVGSIAMAAVLLLGVIAVLPLTPKAFAATSIAGADRFYGPALARVVITDTAKNTAGDTIIAHVDVKRGSATLGSKDMTLTNIGSSGTFELFITTANTFAPSAPTYTAAPGPFILRVNTAPVAATANEQTIDLNGASAASSAAELKDGDSVVVTYGSDTKTIQFAKSSAVASVDRDTAGSGNNIVVRFNDTDANTDPTLVDSFSATGLVTASSGTLGLTGAMFKETGQNTGTFELVVNVGPTPVAPTDGATLTTSSFPSSTTFTINDKDVYQVIAGSLAPYNVITPTTSSITSSKSVTLQNVDGILSTTKEITVGNGILLQVNDADRNIDTKSKDTIAAGVVTVTVAGVTGTVNGISLKETDFGSGLFAPDTTDNKIPITIGGTDSITATGITLTPATLAGDPDVTITYNDPAADPTGAKAFQLVTKILHVPGTLTGPTTQVSVTGKFPLTITDKDLNANSKSVDSFIVTFPASSNTGTPVSFANGLGQLTLKAKGSGVTLGSTALTMTFIETGVDTGVFTASGIDMSIINAAVSGGLSDGDQIEFKYFDNSESPAQTSTATFNIGKPTASISINRGTIPLPRAGTADTSKFTVTINDPTKDTNANSVDTFTLPATAITMTKKDGSTAISPIIMSGLGAKTFTETGPSTGIFTADYTPGSGTETNANMDNAKLKFTYTTGGTTTTASVTIRSYDGAVTADLSALVNGGNMTITVNDPDLNRDPGTVEQATVTVQGKSDDMTLVTISDLKETGPDTGIFKKIVKVGKDFKISDLTTNKFSTSAEIHYTDDIASDLSLAVDREFDASVKTSTGGVAVTPEVVGPGTKMYINVVDPDLNSNPSGVDTTVSGVEYVRITSDRSGANTLTTAVGEETGPNTAVFKTKLTLSPITNLNAVPSPLFSGTSKEVTGFVLPGDILSIRYTDQKDANGAKTTVAKVITVISQDPKINASKAALDVSGTFQLTVADADANTDGDAVDSVTLKLTSTSDPVGITVTALETGPNTGVFVGTASTTAGVTTGSLSVKSGDDVQVKYTDKYPADYATRVKQVVDPSKDFFLHLTVGSTGTTTSTTPSAPALADITGASITEVTAGQQVVINTNVKNNDQQSRPFVAIVEVRDANGITQMLQWQTGTMSGGETKNVGISWVPDNAGKYEVRTFVISSLQNPQVLSDVVKSDVTVS